MQGPPEVRAGAAQDSFHFVEGVKPGAIRSRMPAETLDLFDTLPRTAWIPIERDLEFLAAVRGAFGDDGMRDVLRRSISRHVESPLLSTVVSGAINVFGATPGGLLGVWPRVFGLIFRNFGDIRFERGEREARVVHERCVPGVFTNELYPRSWEAFLLGAFDVARTPSGRVRWSASPAARTLTFDLTW